MPTVIYDPAKIDFDKPGKSHYQVAFHLDSSWGYSLVPLTVINGLKETGPAGRPPGVVAFGGTHGNEWEGQVTVKRLCARSRSGGDLRPRHSRAATERERLRRQPACFAARQRQHESGISGQPARHRFLSHLQFVKTPIFSAGPCRASTSMRVAMREASLFVLPFIRSRIRSQRAEIATVAALFDPPFMLIYSSQMSSGLLTDEAEAEGKITVGGEFGYGESVSRVGASTPTRDQERAALLRTPRRRITKIDPHRQVRPGSRSSELGTTSRAPRRHLGAHRRSGSDVGKGHLLGSLHDFPITHRRHWSYAPIVGRAPDDAFPGRLQKGATLYVIAQGRTGRHRSRRLVGGRGARRRLTMVSASTSRQAMRCSRRPGAPRRLRLLAVEDRLARHRYPPGSDSAAAPGTPPGLRTSSSPRSVPHQEDLDVFFEIIRNATRA